jgi:predicted metal-dependent peptidase
MKHKSLKLYGHQVDIVEVPPNIFSQNNLGQTNIKDNRLHLNASLPESMKHSTLLHEVIHLVLDHNGHQNVSRDETVVCALEVGLFTFLRDNPGLVAEMAGVEPRFFKKIR